MLKILISLAIAMVINLAAMAAPNAPFWFYVLFGILTYTASHNVVSWFLDRNHER